METDSLTDCCRILIKSAIAPKTRIQFCFWPSSQRHYDAVEILQVTSYQHPAQGGFKDWQHWLVRVELNFSLNPYSFFSFLAFASNADWELVY
jgi:hypothetical protein